MRARIVCRCLLPNTVAKEITQSGLFTFVEIKTVTASSAGQMQNAECENLNPLRRKT